MELLILGITLENGLLDHRDRVRRGEAGHRMGVN